MSNTVYNSESKNKYFHFDTLLGNSLLLFYDPFLALYFSDLSLGRIGYFNFCKFH